MTDDTISTAPGPAKADLETLVLRAAPGWVTRFRCGAIVAIAAAGSTAIVGVAWLALKPATLSLIAPSEDNQIATKAPTDALAGTPRVMATCRSLASRCLAISRDRSSTINARWIGPGDPMPQSAADRTALDPGGNTNSQQRKNELIGRANHDDDINPHALVQPVSPWTLHAGSVISASLITGLNSDLSGLVTAQVAENVYDSVTGRSLLIPQGSRLIGSYDSVVAFGQSRALVVWQRIILPDGSSIRIDNVPATDTQGYVGLSDCIDRHSWQLLKGLALSHCSALVRN